MKVNQKPRFVYLLRSALIALASIPALAQEPVSEFVQYLIPIDAPEVTEERPPRWISYLWVTNSGDEPVFLSQFAGPERGPCQFTCPPDTLQAGDSRRVGVTERGRGGGILYTTRDGAESLHFSPILLREHGSGDQGTSIPVTRVDTIDPGATVHLPGVSLGPESREHLRIYAPGKLRTTVVLRVFEPDNELISETFHEMQWTPPGREPVFIYEDFPEYPAFAFVRLEDIVQFEGIVRVEVEPLEDDARIWALLTVTNNVTNRVTAYYPQP